MSDQKRTMQIEIANLTEAQAIAIEDMLATWQQGGSLGCSRWTRFFADGDGDFRPRIQVDGHAATFTTLGEAWRGDYKIDYDMVAWKLHYER